MSATDKNSNEQGHVMFPAQKQDFFLQTNPFSFLWALKMEIRIVWPHAIKRLSQGCDTDAITLHYMLEM